MPGPNGYGAPLFGTPDHGELSDALRYKTTAPSTLDEILTELREIKKFLQHTVIQQKLAEVQAEYAALKAKHEGKE